MLKNLGVISCPVEYSVDNNDGGFEAVEGEIVCDNEVPIAKPCNVRVSRYSAQQRLSCQGTEILFNAAQKSFRGRGVVDGNIFTNVGKILVRESKQSD